MLTLSADLVSALPLAVTGIRDSQTQINGALMLQCYGWCAWAVLVAVGDDTQERRALGWFAAFLALKGTAASLVFTLAQATALDREYLQNTLYVGAGALASHVWSIFLLRRWPDAWLPRVLCALVVGGQLLWLGALGWSGLAPGWVVWPWAAAAPVVLGAAWLAWREKNVAFAAVAAALTIDFADPRTVLCWYSGFVQELSLTWPELERLAPDAARLAPGNGLFVVPVNPAALAWFALTAATIWGGFIAWHFTSRRGARIAAMPLVALGMTIVGFAIYGLSLSVAFRSMSRETFSRLATLASVAAKIDDRGAESAAEWSSLRQANRELGLVFRWQLDANGRRVVLDPIAATGRRDLPLLPLERATVAAGQPYGLGPFMTKEEASFYSAVPMAPGADGSPRWLAVIGPLERFYLYKRPSALLGNLVNYLCGGIGVVMLGFMLHRERGLRQRLARERAEESVQIKTAFLAKVSHELRTPLQSILGYGDLLERDAPTGAQRSRVAALRQHGQLMLRLVNDLLDLSAVETGAFRLVQKPVSLADLVPQTVESLAPRAAAKNLALTCTIDPAVPAWVLADPERIRQITLNLVANAIKFTPSGRVTVALNATTRTADRCGLELVVTDTGPGISAADQRRLFHMFSRLDPAAAHEGSGLGLALVAALCRSTGGDVVVESDGRTGSCFRATFTVPLSQPPPPAVSPPPAALAGRRILIVDDNALVRELFAGWLAELGAACEVAVDGEEALLRADAGQFDAVILDVALPRIDGITVAQRWRKQGRTWRIVGVSAHAGETERRHALEAGMDAFLVKPVELSLLAHALTDAAPPAAIADGRVALRARLAEHFRREADSQWQTVRAALAAGDWTALKTRAHYLKSSAGVVGDVRLYDACGAIEEAADARDAARARAACDECRHVIAPWIAPSDDGTA